MKCNFFPNIIKSNVFNTYHRLSPSREKQLALSAQKHKKMDKQDRDRHGRKGRAHVENNEPTSRLPTKADYQKHLDVEVQQMQAEFESNRIKLE